MLIIYQLLQGQILSGKTVKLCIILVGGCITRVRKAATTKARTSLALVVAPQQQLNDRDCPFYLVAKLSKMQVPHPPVALVS